MSIRGSRKREFKVTMSIRRRVRARGSKGGGEVRVRILELIIIQFRKIFLAH